MARRQKDCMDVRATYVVYFVCGQAWSVDWLYIIEIHNCSPHSVGSGPIETCVRRRCLSGRLIDFLMQFIGSNLLQSVTHSTYVAI